MGFGYDYGYDYGYGSSMGVEDVAGIILVVFGAVFLVALAVGAIFYVLQSVGTYTIAKRRGIHNPWLAWLPIGNMWILGCISDQYQYVARGKKTNRRIALLALMIVSYAATAVYYVIYLITMIGAMVGDGEVTATSGILTLLLSLGMLVISLISGIINYVAVYDLYRSCDPDSAVVYLVLSILFSISLPILMFICRKKDLGMPAPAVKPVQPILPVQPVQPVQPAPAAETPAAEAPTEE